MCNWKQATPREVLAPIRGTTDLIEHERNDLIKALANFNVEALLELGERKHRSLFSLVHEAISGLLIKYPDRSQE